MYVLLPLPTLSIDTGSHDEGTWSILTAGVSSSVNMSYRGERKETIPGAV